MRLPKAAFALLPLSLCALHCGEPGPSASAKLQVPEQAPATRDEAPSARNAVDEGERERANEDGPTWLATGTPSPTGDAAPRIGDSPASRCRQDLAKSRWVACTDQGKLRYAVDRATGASLPDTSRVGYRGGDAPLPTLPIVQHVAPSGGDDTALLQSAINAVGARSPDANGWRGRLVLAPGVFRVNRPLLVARSGVVVEGTASVGPQATTVKLTGAATALFYVRGSGNAVTSGPQLTVSKLPVPTGKAQLTLTSTAGLAVGDTVRITSTRNAAWKDKKWGGKADATWSDAMSLQLPRQIVALQGSTITLDSPLPDTLPVADEAEAAGATVEKLDTRPYTREFGFAHMRLVGRLVHAEASSPKLLTAFVVENAEDGFIDDVEAKDFGAGTVSLGAWTRHITVQDVRALRTGEQSGTATPADISLRGQLHLVQGCASNGNKTLYVATYTTDAAGPNVVQNFRAQGSGAFAPQQRWSTGLLLDNVYVPEGGIAYADRKSAGEGWAMGFGAVYNSLAGTHNAQQRGMDVLPGHTVDQPPGATNWGIGLVGPNHSAVQPDGHYDSPGKPVSPASLYVAQLGVRRGKAGLQQVMGPWHLRDEESGTCLSVDVARAGAFVVARDCHETRQLALWDITSRGSFRLGGTSLCLDADSDRRDTPAKLAVCVDDTEQHWTVNVRGGEATSVALQTSGADEEACLRLDGKVAVVGACEASDTWQLLSTHLAR